MQLRQYGKKIIRMILATVLFCLPFSFPSLAYQSPGFLDSGFHDDAAIISEGVRMDLSAVSDGYMGISVVSEHRLKFQVLKDDSTYTYDISSDGEPSIIPLQSGDGEYTFRVMENVVDSKYAILYATDCYVSITDEFQPFLRPNDYAAYSRDSDCVALAADMAESAADALGVVAAVFDYICSNVVYDYYKAVTVQSGYLPTPDETLATGQGICFDYASLAASMLRSQGIPCKVVLGYVSPDDVYHAWNMFYTDATGWVTVDYQVSQDSWNRLDLTFSANGADGTFIGDGGNYSDMYYY